MSFFTGASDALQEALIQQEQQKRQALLDSLQVQDRQEKARADQQNEQIREGQLEDMAAERRARTADANAKAAVSAANLLAPGQAIDAATAATLGNGGLGALVTQKPGTLASRSIQGTVQTTDGAPVVSDVTETPHAATDAQTVFAGTAKQQEAVRQQAARAAYIASLSDDDPTKKFLMAQDATGDKTLPSALYATKKTQPTFHTVKGVGLVRVDSDGTPTVLMPSKDTTGAKIGTPQIFYGKDNQPHAIRFMPDGTAQEVQLPPGLLGKTPPKPTPKTVEQIQAEAEARAHGTAQGKAEGTPPGWLSTVAGTVFGNGATAPPQQPKPGDIKTFPNGRKAVWDGTGWVAQ